MLLDKNTLCILGAFASDYTKKIYGSDLAKKLNMNQKTVSNILNKLEKEHILKFAIEGKNKYYYFNKFNSHIREIVKLIEIGRKIAFLEKYKHLQDLFKELEERSKGIVVIFGSYAKGAPTKSSDLDVFLIGSCSNVENLETLYNLKINIIFSEKKKFDKNEPFIKEIIKSHIVLKGVEEFVELLWQ